MDCIFSRFVYINPSVSSRMYKFLASWVIKKILTLKTNQNQHETNSKFQCRNGSKLKPTDAYLSGKITLLCELKMEKDEMYKFSAFR